tara:strand:- start:287 stop:910 length:624 start_codon:yes stop_codon:yes gene_type:complete
MSMDLDFSSAEFSRAVNEYIGETSKDSATAINGKTADFLYKTGKHVAKADRSKVNRTIQNPKFITWFLNKTFGKGGWTVDDYGDGRTWAAGVKMLRRRLSAIGYSRHGLFTAAKDFKGESTRPGKEPRPRTDRKRHKAITTRTTQANQRVHKTAFIINIGASSQADASSKKRLYTRPAALASAEVAKDTRKYLERKYAKRARDHRHG